MCLKDFYINLNNLVLYCVLEKHALANCIRIVQIRRESLPIKCKGAYLAAVYLSKRIYKNNIIAATRLF